MAEPRRSTLREYFEALVIAVVFLGFTNTFVVKTFFIPSSSMVETLLIGDHLFVNRYVFGLPGSELEKTLTPMRPLRHGDVVIFRSPESPTTDLVKRCIGLPGDVISIVDKQLFRNGEPVDESAFTWHLEPEVIPNRQYVSPQVRHRDNFGPFEVPEDHYFFMGDNRDNSYDSRAWGAVPRHYIKGRALLIYWSYGGKTPDGQWRGWTDKLGQLGRTAAGFFTKTRWERTLHLIR